MSALEIPTTTPAQGGGIPDLQWETRSSNTILGTADKGKTIAITATITQTFEADETLGDGWWVILHNAGTVATTIVTLDPAGTETIDGATTLKLYAGEQRIIYCNGSGNNFNSVTLAEGHVRGGGFTAVVKTGDESISSNTTVQDDDELQFATVNGAIYEVEIVLIFGSPAGAGTPDIKTACGEDSSTTRGVFSASSLNATGTLQITGGITNQGGTGGLMVMGTDTTDRMVRIFAQHVGGGATFKFMWAQNTSGVNATIVRAGSVLRYRRIK